MTEPIDALVDEAQPPYTPPPFTSPELLQDVISLLTSYSSILTPEAKERASTAFVRALVWMDENPTAWTFKPVQPIDYIGHLDKPAKLIVRGRVVDVYKAVTI